jgi:hypothetical protein
MTHNERDTEKYALACDLAHELFLPSYALVLEDAEPERLYGELHAKGYQWTGTAWDVVV